MCCGVCFVSLLVSCGLTYMTTCDETKHHLDEHNATHEQATRSEHMRECETSREDEKHIARRRPFFSLSGKKSMSCPFSNSIDGLMLHHSSERPSQRRVNHVLCCCVSPFQYSPSSLASTVFVLVGIYPSVRYTSFAFSAPRQHAPPIPNTRLTNIIIVIIISSSGDS